MRVFFILRISPYHVCFLSRSSSRLVTVADGVLDIELYCGLKAHKWLPRGIVCELIILHILLFDHPRRYKQVLAFVLYLSIHVQCVCAYSVCFLFFPQRIKYSFINCVVPMSFINRHVSVTWVQNVLKPHEHRRVTLGRIYERSPLLRAFGVCRLYMMCCVRAPTFDFTHCTFVCTRFVDSALPPLCIL